VRAGPAAGLYTHPSFGRNSDESCQRQQCWMRTPLTGPDVTAYSLTHERR